MFMSVILRQLHYASTEPSRRSPDLNSPLDESFFDFAAPLILHLVCPVPYPLLILPYHSFLHPRVFISKVLTITHSIDLPLSQQNADLSKRIRQPPQLGIATTRPDDHSDCHPHEGQYDHTDSCGPVEARHNHARLKRHPQDRDGEQFDAPARDRRHKCARPFVPSERQWKEMNRRALQWYVRGVFIATMGQSRYGCKTLTSCSSHRYEMPRTVAEIVSKNFGPKAVELKKLLNGSFEWSLA